MPCIWSIHIINTKKTTIIGIKNTKKRYVTPQKPKFLYISEKMHHAFTSKQVIEV